jgi:hypothetical protein
VIDSALDSTGTAQFADFADVTKQHLDKHMTANFEGPSGITQSVSSQMIAQVPEVPWCLERASLQKWELRS